MPKAPSTLVPHIPVVLTHQTDLDCAAVAFSRILPDWAQDVLLAAAAGKEVSAWTLHCALDQALSACATRHGQSMGRRHLTKKVRHLVYKCDAVIENHLAGLEPMEPGARSPKIAALEAEIAENHAQAVEEGRQLREEISALEAEVETRGTMLADLRAERDAIRQQRDDLAVSRERGDAIFFYAFSLLGEQEQYRVLGYSDRVNEQ